MNNSQPHRGKIKNIFQHQRSFLFQISRDVNREVRKKRHVNGKEREPQQKTLNTSLVSYLDSLDSIKYSPKNHFLSEEVFILTASSSVPDAGTTHVLQCMEAFSLTFLADGAASLSSWAGRAA